ncbi:MAG: type II secretion system protein [Pseudomonadota bacterium]
MGVLFMVAIASLGSLTAMTIWTTEQQREKEWELLFIGNEFRKAIGEYYERSPGTVKKYPLTLSDLLKDDRFLVPQRYLRRIYRDPITGSKDWGLVRAPDGGIMGMFSKSTAATIKTDNFRTRDRALAGKRQYVQWQFVYYPTERRDRQVGPR